MAKLDFAKAYDSLTNSALQSTLEQAGCDVEDIHAIMRETDGVEVSFQLEGVQGDPVELTNGLLQGDPPSPVYFTATTDRVLKPVVAKWEQEKVGLHLDGMNFLWLGGWTTLTCLHLALRICRRWFVRSVMPAALYRS